MPEASQRFHPTGAFLWVPRTTSSKDDPVGRFGRPVRKPLIKGASLAFWRGVQGAERSCGDRRTIEPVNEQTQPPATGGAGVRRGGDLSDGAPKALWPQLALQVRWVNLIENATYKHSFRGARDVVLMRGHSTMLPSPALERQASADESVDGGAT